MALEWLRDLQRFNAGRKQQRALSAPPAPLSMRGMQDQMKATEAATGMAGLAGGGTVNNMGGYGMSASRFTGNGADGVTQKYNPTAINSYSEHEGEVVIPADKVRSLGGPENLNSLIEQLAMKKVERSSGMKGYADPDAGSVTGTVKQPAYVPGTAYDGNKGANGETSLMAAKPAGSSSPYMNQTVGLPANIGKSNVGLAGMPGSGKPAAPVINKPAAPVVTKPAPASALAGAALPKTGNAGLDLIQDRATGNDPLGRKLEDVSRNTLAASQAADKTAMGQQIAQTVGRNAPGGAATAAALMGERGQQIQTAQLETGLAKERSAQQLDAARDLNIGLRDQRDHDYKVGTDKFNSQIASKDFEGAASTYKNLYGVDLDVSSLQNAENNEILATATTNLSTNIATLATKDGFDPESNVGWDDPMNKPQLENMARASGYKQNPDGTWTGPAGSTKTADQFMQDTWQSMKMASTPEWQAYGSMSDDIISDILTPADGMGEDGKTPWSLGTFTFGGKTGRAAAITLFNKVQYRGGMTVDNDGDITFDPDILSAVMSGESVGGDEVVDPLSTDALLEKKFGAGSDQIARNKEALAGKPDGTIMEFDTGEVWTKKGEKWEQTTAPRAAAASAEFVPHTTNGESFVTVDGKEIKESEYAADPGKYGGFEKDPRFKDKTKTVTIADKDYHYDARAKEWVSGGIWTTPPTGADPDVFADAQPGDFIQDDSTGKSYYIPKDGESKAIKVIAMGAPNKYGHVLGRNLDGKPSYWNGTTWQALSEGQVIHLENTGTFGNGMTPVEPGTYRVKNTPEGWAYVSVDDPTVKFPAVQTASNRQYGATALAGAVLQQYADKG